MDWSSTAPRLRDLTCFRSAERAGGAPGVGVLPRAEALEGSAGGEHVGVAVAPADQLHADRQLLDVPGRDRSGRVPGEVERVREAPADERIDLDSLDALRAHRV